MQFTTQVPVPKYDHQIDYGSRIVSLGSCFAVNIAEKFEYYKFRNLVNPFGILFHPLALERFISAVANKTQYGVDDVFFHNERWHCFDAHSDLSHPDQRFLLDNLNSATSATALNDASHVIITLGTAWVYRNTASGKIVANCHKIPQKEFTKELLSVDAIGNSLRNCIALLKAENPHVKIIFTVSPVRHLKDGVVENQLSKSHLITALHHVLADAEATYFPSYEIVMDELRDYRFYAADMLHPNQTAIDYIWSRFSQTFISEEARDTMTTVEAIRRGLAHRPFNPESAEHQKFIAGLNQKIAHLQKSHPHIAF